jgi:hypothetical protein
MSGEHVQNRGGKFFSMPLASAAIQQKPGASDGE